MSFSTEVKNEICTLNFSKTENITELSAFVRNNNNKQNNVISLITENPKIARKIFTLFKELYEVSPIIEEKIGANFKKKRFYFINIHSKQKDIESDLMLSLPIPKDYLVDSEDLKRAYLRGAFLATGSINDPKTSRYHLAYFINYKKEALFISDILNYFNIHNKIIRKNNNYMIYVKEAEKIGDFLRIISTNRAVLYYEDIRIYRDHKNMTNRLNNCEQANVDKIINSANLQIKEINSIISLIGIEGVDEKIKEVMLYRLKYPESSLSDLSEIISKETNRPITKSGLNHRFRKIKELRNKLENK